MLYTSLPWITLRDLTGMQTSARRTTSDKTVDMPGAMPLEIIYLGDIIIQQVFEIFLASANQFRLAFFHYVGR